MNALILAFLGLVIALLIFVDYPRSVAAFEGETFRIWYLDPAFGFDSGEEKGPGMVTSMIFNVIAGLAFISVAMRLHRIRKIKQNHYLSNSIFYSALYLGIGRFIEGYYIITETDLRGMLFALGRSFIPLDNFALILFFSLCCDVFFAEQIEKGAKISDHVYKIGWVTFIFSWLAVLTYFPQHDIIQNLANYFNIALIVIILVVSVSIEIKIMGLTQRIEERKKEVRLIGVILVLFIIVVILTVLLYTTFPNLLQYIFRTIKNALLAVIAIIYYFAFIKPFNQGLGSS
jgi:hypothetical protein